MSAAFLFVLATGATAQPIPVGSELQVNLTTAGPQSAPSAAAGPSGLHAIAWQGPGDASDVWLQLLLVAWEGPDGSGPGVFLRRFAADLTSPGAAVQVDTVPAGFQTSPSLACDGSGNVIVAWERGSDVVARRFDRLLTPLSSVFAVPVAGAGLRTQPRVGSASSGDFLISWEGWSEDEGGPGVFLRAFDFLELPSTSTLAVNTFGTGAQHHPALAVAPTGHALAAWESQEQDGDGAGVFSQRYAFPGGDLYTLVPCRVFDTRQSIPLQSGVERTFAISTVCGVPVTARAVSVNLTVVGGTAGGEVVVYPGDLLTPGTSSVSFAAGQTRADNAILALARNGAGTLAARASVGGSGTVHLILDVNGYFE